MVSERVLETSWSCLCLGMQYLVYILVAIIINDFKGTIKIEKNDKRCSDLQMTVPCMGRYLEFSTADSSYWLDQIMVLDDQ